MAEWLYEAGIGEIRAALVEDGVIVEAAIEPFDGTLRAGTVALARLTALLRESGRGEIVLEPSGERALLVPLPRGIAEGARLLVEIVREAIPETGNPKLPVARIASDGAAPQPGPDLLARIGARQEPVVPLAARQPDALEKAGWSELLEEATTGLIAFPGGMLRMALTPAMTLFDVDGGLPAADLARAGATAAAAAIRRFDIGGSIGIDLPTLDGKPARLAAAAAIDAVLPPPFERTAVNGFGFVQVVRRRIRPSLPERLHADPVAAAARALLRRAERTPGHGPRTITAAPTVVARIAGEPAWIEALERRLGAAVALRADAAVAISAGHVQSHHPAP